MSIWFPTKTSQRNKSLIKQEASYLQKYRRRLEIRNRGTSSGDSIEINHLQQQISGRGDKLFQLFTMGADMDNIKIEQEQESQIMRSQYLQTELLWFKKIDETKHQIATIKQNCEKEAKVIKDLQKELNKKRVKVAQQTQKLRKVVDEYDSVYVQTFQQEMDILQQEYDSTFQKGTLLLTEAKSEYDQLMAQNNEEDLQIQALLQEINTLKEYESETYQGKLSNLLDEQENMKAEIVKMQEQMLASRRQQKHIQSSRPIPEENHRKYLELYQKMFINKKLDQMQELVKKKQKQIQRLEDYEKKKTLFRLKKGEIEERDRQLDDLKKVQEGLQEDIRENSTILLNLYQYESQKRK